jgi:predicted SAM-dependent methyltransferase
MQRARVLKHLVLRRKRAHAFKAQGNIKINYGCGHLQQPGYVNVDLRWTPAIDLLADLSWCARVFEGVCKEVYLSHVLEHYSSPGRDMRDGAGTVIEALNAIHQMLFPGGTVRLAVPDFGTLARLYADDKVPLYPRLLGRIVGEQDYEQNRHRCAFDRDFLEMLLTQTGFTNVQVWEPEALGLRQDSSFDHIEDVKTSLNLAAQK